MTIVKTFSLKNLESAIKKNTAQIYEEKEIFNTHTHNVEITSCIATLFFALFFHAGSSVATVYTGDIDVGSGQDLSYTFSGDDILQGNLTVHDTGIVRVSTLDDVSVTGRIEGTLGGHLYLTAGGDSTFHGVLDINNGAHANIYLYGNAHYIGDLLLESSGGMVELNLADDAEISGQITGGSSTNITVRAKDRTTMSSGLTVTSGGKLTLYLSDSASLQGPIISESGSSVLDLYASGTSIVDGDLTVQGSGTSHFTLWDSASYTGNMDVSGSGILTFTTHDNTTISGDLTTLGGSQSTFTLNDASRWVGNVNTEPGGSTTVTLNDSSNLTGDLFTGAGTTATFTLNGNSWLKGSSAIEWGNADISLNGSGTAWYVTQSNRISAANGATGTQYASAVSNLSLTDGAWVYLGAQNYNMNGAANRVQLDILNLSGNGNFELRPHVNGIGAGAYNDGDLIHVTNTNGSHSLLVPSAQLGLGSVAVNGQEVLKLVHSVDGGGSFSLYQGKSVDIGQYTYKLIQNSDGHWYLVADGGVTEPGGGGGGSGGGGGGGTGTGVPPDLNRPAETSSNFITTNYVITYIELQTLLQRMGDLRHTREGDVWARSFVGRLDATEFHQLSKYSMDYYGIQFGADKNLSSISDKFFVGVMGGYTWGSPEHDKSSSDMKSFHAGLYALWGTEDDLYIDATAKVSHIRNQFKTSDSQGMTVKGDGSSNAYTFGLEIGKRFYFAEKRQGFYVEPQVQGVYTYQNKVSFSSDNGLDTKMSAYDSTLLRAGGLMGYNLKESQIPLNVYLKAGYVREFTADVDVHYNKVFHNNYNYKGEWLDLGLGVTGEIANRHSLYVDVDYASGSRFDKKQVNVGYRFVF
ncbi:autotransporter outer membrane beta-barrel domain-containing protein [Entomomonas sp. E2T0]|uniref:autotransporter outer membrane beta-barrel domain-containing protein n=1 Tax=Entomomonas sp. E2T0 TaxID=2930213 RepID=UPI00222834E2|nr:autotransporter outer membrane beta-barrel domain-containing protein [Entomomonas sp. E2T0]UYZ82740.1 autotransporter outer membrane beta-barrel domain-containing protein [Entomomonas sp. E2T0]